MAIDYTVPQFQTTQDASVPKGTIQTPTTPSPVYPTPDIGSIYDQTVPPESQLSKERTAGLNFYKQLLGEQAQSQQEQAQQFQNLGGAEAQTRLADLTAQYNVADLQNQAQQQAYLGQTRAIGGYTQTAQNLGMEDINRANAVKKLGIASDIAINQGRVDTAKSLAEQAIKAKYGDVQAKIDQTKAFLDVNKDLLSREDAKNLQRQQFILQNKQKEIDAKVKDQTDISNMIIDARAQGAPKEIADRAQRLAQSGASKLDIAQSLGQYSGDYLKNELTRQQIKTEKAQQANYYANADKSRAEIGTSGVTSKPLTEAQAKDLTYAQRTSQSLPTLSNLESKIVKMNPIEFATQWQLVQSPLTSGQVSPEVRQYYQASQNFTSATLRRESGASIAKNEYSNAFSNYLPYPGDDAKTLAQKKQARETVSNSFKQNVPGYEQRTATTEDTYLDKIALPATTKVNEKVNNPIANYRMKLQSLPGTKQ